MKEILFTYNYKTDKITNPKKYNEFLLESNINFGYMHTIQVINIKCWGCINTVTKALESIWVTDISVDIATWKISHEFSWDINIVVNKLSSLGYPEINSEEAKSFLKKAKSFVSCAIWKIS